MSCCGESRTNPPPQQNASAWNAGGAPITHQPGFQPGMHPASPPGHPGAAPWSPYPPHNPYAPAPPPAAYPPPHSAGIAGQPNPWGVQAAMDPRGSHYHTRTGTLNSATNSYTPLLDPNVQVPTPVHHPGNRASTVSPPLPGIAPTPPAHSTGSIIRSPSVGYQASSMIQSPPPRDDGKLSVSIDFGTTFSGVAYGSSRIDQGKVQQILQWPGSFEQFRKIPTCLLYDAEGRVLAWGLEAKNANPIPGVIRCEWFKLFLEPKVLRDPGSIDPRLPVLPPRKQARDLIVDFLAALWEYAKVQITREVGVADLNTADVWLTVPAAWDAKGCAIMKEAAIAAGLVQSAHANDRDWRERLRIITEPEAAAVHCGHLTSLHQLKPNQTFMVCDAGGGTVDLAVYRVLGNLQSMEIAEVCARSGANCGSIFLDLRFRELVKKLLENHPVHLDPASLASFMHAFGETKLGYQGESQDGSMFQFTCFNVEDPDDPDVGLYNGELSIPGNLLRREVFDPVINEVLDLIEKQMQRIDQHVDALMLVGGFSGSEYLFKRVDERFGTRVNIIARPSDADTATVRGAALYGLARKQLVSSIISPKSYIMKVKLPAEDLDRSLRPAYITMNADGSAICENRLKYLVQKGALLRKGQMIRAPFAKFSRSLDDRLFVAVLYTADGDDVWRYADEGETTELCKWTVDLGTLPSFQHYAANNTGQGFYTQFELGLEIDSVEVRGAVLYEGREVGRVVFDFLS